MTSGTSESGTDVLCCFAGKYQNCFSFCFKDPATKVKICGEKQFCLLSPESFSWFPETWMKTICCCSVTKVVLLQNLSAADFSFYKFYIQMNYLTSLHFWWILYFFKDFREIQIKQTADWPVSHVISSYSSSLWGWLLLIKTIEWTGWWHYSVNSDWKRVSMSINTWGKDVLESVPNITCLK